MPALKTVALLLIQLLKTFPAVWGIVPVLKTNFLKKAHSGCLLIYRANGCCKPQANLDFSMKMLNKIYYETTHVMSMFFSLLIYEVDICGNAKDKGVISFLTWRETDSTFHMTLQQNSHTASYKNLYECFRSFKSKNYLSEARA